MSSAVVFVCVKFNDFSHIITFSVPLIKNKYNFIRADKHSVYILKFSLPLLNI